MPDLFKVIRYLKEELQTPVEVIYKRTEEDLQDLVAHLYGLGSADPQPCNGFTTYSGADTFIVTVDNGDVQLWKEAQAVKYMAIFNDLTARYPAIIGLQLATFGEVSCIPYSPECLYIIRSNEYGNHYITKFTNCKIICCEGGVSVDSIVSVQYIFYGADTVSESIDFPKVIKDHLDKVANGK